MKTSIAFSTLAIPGSTSLPALVSASTTSFVRIQPESDASNVHPIIYVDGKADPARPDPEVYFRTEGDGKFTHVGYGNDLQRYQMVNAGGVKAPRWLTSTLWARGVKERNEAEEGRFTVGLLPRADPAVNCHLSGNYNGAIGETTIFHFQTSDAYLFPWEAQNGVSVICTGPEPKKDMLPWMPRLFGWAAGANGGIAGTAMGSIMKGGDKDAAPPAQGPSENSLDD